MMNSILYLGLLRQLTLFTFCCWGVLLSRAHASPGVVLWDSGSSAGNADDRNGWKTVPSDLLQLEANPAKASSDPGYYGSEYAFRGDAVIENSKLLAILSPSPARLTLFAKPFARPSSEPSSVGHDRLSKILELSPASSNSNSPFTLQLIRNADDAIVLGLSVRGSEGPATLFSFDRTAIVGINPAAGLSRFTVAAPLAYVVSPSFIGDDLIYGAPSEAVGDALSLPAEQMLLGLLRGGDTELVMTWPKGSQRIGLALAKEANGSRQIESIDFGADGQSFYLAGLNAPRIWHDQTLTSAYLEKDVPIQWKRPFPARWKTELYEETVKTSFAFRDSQGDIWRGVAGSYNYPVWFEGDQAVYHLSKKVPPKGDSLIYFLEGNGTPEWVQTPTEILQATLGRPASEPILDLAGRKLRTHHRRGANGVHRACTCGCTEAIQAVFEAGDEVERQEEIKGELEDMVYFVHAHVNRIGEYRRFADDLVRYLQEKKATLPNVSGYIEDIVQLAQQIPQEYTVQKENMKSFAYADELVNRTLALTRKKAPDNLKAYMELLNDWRAMGGAQDYVLAKCHVITRQLAQEAGYGCARLPEAIPLAQEVRARARETLRNPDGYEIWPDY